MEFYSSRKLMFKAWNTETRLMMRLDTIPCVKGELMKHGHILLQFTGLIDKHREEIYEMDIVLIGSDRYIVKWITPSWAYLPMSNDFDATTARPAILTAVDASKMIRLCSYFESVASTT